MKQNLINNIVDFDKSLKKLDNKMEIIIIGGGALVLHNIISRITYDLDSFILVNKKIKTFEDLDLDILASRFTFNSNADAFGLSRLLTLEDEWLDLKMEGLKNIKLITPSIEFIVFTKLLSTMDRSKDFKDIVFVKDRMDTFNFKKLEKFLYYWSDNIAQRKEKEAFNVVYEKWISDINDF